MKKVFLKLILIKILLFTKADLFAPVSGSVAIPQDYPVDPYQKLILAVGKVETGLDTLAFNPMEEAVGYLQIRPIRLQDYNMRTGSSFTMKDLYDYRVSDKIFRYYADKYGPYDFETAARRWNGSGSMTIDYWNRVKVLL